MNNDFSKSVDFEELPMILNKCLHAPYGISADDAEASDTEPEETPPVDMERLRHVMGDDPEEVREIVELYLGETTKNIAKLHAAIAADDAEQVDLLAHNCVGSSANCGMTALIAPLRELERKGREKNLSGAARLVAQVSHELEHVESFLREQIA